MQPHTDFFLISVATFVDHASTISHLRPLSNLVATVVDVREVISAHRVKCVEKSSGHEQPEKACGEKLGTWTQAPGYRRRLPCRTSGARK